MNATLDTRILSEKLRSNARVFGGYALVALTVFLIAGCSDTEGTTPATGDTIEAVISPNLAQARDKGFDALVGHPPFEVDFSGDVKSSHDSLSYNWDFDGDGGSDSSALDPEPFIYSEPGEYSVTLTVGGEDGPHEQVRQRIVVVGRPDWPDWRYGVADHLNRSHQLYSSNAEVERSARLIGEAGIDAVRVDLLWSAVQPLNENHYEWEDYDYLVDVGKRYGFDLLPILDYSAEWASNAPTTQDGQDRVYSPPVPEKYAWFAYKSAERYRGDVPAWEIWNEPNYSGFWQPEPDPEIYADILREAYLAIKYADPKAAVVLGGLAGAGDGRMPPEQFLQGVYNAGGDQFFDAVGSHPYASRSSEVDEMGSQVADLRTVMLDNDDAEKPIWVTESGISSVAAAAVTDETQATWLKHSLDAFGSLDYVPVAFWYNFREKGTDPNDYEQNYGLVETDWTTKPAYEAYKGYIANDRRLP